MVIAIGSGTWALIYELALMPAIFYWIASAKWIHVQLWVGVKERWIFEKYKNWLY